MSKELRKTLIYIFLPLVIIFLKDYLINNIDLFITNINIINIREIVIIIIYLLMGIGLYYSSLITLKSKLTYQIISSIYILLFIYIILSLLGIINFIPTTYIQFILNNMNYYSIYVGFMILNLIRR